MMSFALGIDIGATSLHACLRGLHACDDDAAVALPLGEDGPTAPAVAFLRADGDLLFGDPALDAAVSAPERLVRDLPGRVGDDVPIAMGEQLVAADDMFAAAVEWVAARATAQQSRAPEAIGLVHPPTWGAHRLGLVHDALRRRGLDDVALVSTPEAVANGDAVLAATGDSSTIAVYDLGGASFTASVLRRTDAWARVIGAPQRLETLGGDDIDDVVVQHVGRHIPGGLDGIGTGPRSTLLALGHLRQESRTAKTALSSATDVSIPVRSPHRITSVRLVRAEFESLIEPLVDEPVTALRRALSTADVEGEQLDAIVLAGGSTRIPLISQRLSETFERPIIDDAQFELAASRGAARLAAVRLAHGASEAPTEVATQRGQAATEVPTAAAASHSPAHAAVRRTEATQRATHGSPVVSTHASDIGAIIYGSAEAAIQVDEASRTADRAWYRRRGVRAAMVSAAVAVSIVLIMPAMPLSVSIGPPIPRAFGQVNDTEDPLEPESAVETATPEPTSVPFGDLDADGDGDLGAAGPGGAAPDESNSPAKPADVPEPSVDGTFSGPAGSGGVGGGESTGDAAPVDDEDRPDDSGDTSGGTGAEPTADPPTSPEPTPDSPPGADPDAGASFPEVRDESPVVEPGAVTVPGVGTPPGSDTIPGPETPGAHAEPIEPSVPVRWR